jgi:hypothetical protein
LIPSDLADFPLPQSSLKHRELDHPILDLAPREAGASDSFKLGTMFVKIAEGLALCPKRRLETAHLPNRADRQYERNRVPRAWRSLRHDLDTFRHGPPSR